MNQVGDCNTARPSMLEMAASAKWDAWRKLLGMDKPTAAEGCDAAPANLAVILPAALA